MGSVAERRKATSSSPDVILGGRMYIKKCPTFWTLVWDFCLRRAQEVTAALIMGLTLYCSSNYRLHPFLAC